MEGKSPQTFANLLKAGIQQIHSHERRHKSVIQDELGYRLGYKGGAMLEYWGKGKGTPQPDHVAILAREIMRRGKMDATWLTAFLESVGLVDRQTLIEELFPTAVAATPTPIPHASSTVSPDLSGVEAPLLSTALQPEAIAATAATESDDPFLVFQQKQARRARKDRYTLLHRVYSHWIEGVLAQSLPGGAALSPQLRPAPGWADRELALGGSASSPRHVAPLAVADVVRDFVEKHHSLLILGEPGAGKSTLLLTLARDLLAVAQHDPTQPIPVVLQLASWAAKRQRFDLWLVEELRTKYHLPKTVAHNWLARGELLLLLDGLDEVPASSCNACVRAINDFGQEQPEWVSFVVCCRQGEYAALSTRLQCQSTLIVQPLDDQQIAGYLAAVGSPANEVSQILGQDQLLRELSTTPLMLNIMATTGAESLRAAVPGADSIATWRQHLLQEYVDRALQRWGFQSGAPGAQTVKRLAWLARQMLHHSTALFMLEALQPSWLEPGLPRRAYAAITALIGGLLYWLVLGLIFGSTAGLVGGLLGAALFFLRTEVELTTIKPAEVLGWSWSAMRTGLVGGLLFGLLFGLSGALTFWLVFGLIGGQSLGVISNLLLKTRDNRRYTANYELLIGLIAGIILSLPLDIPSGLLWGALGAVLPLQRFNPPRYLRNPLPLFSGLVCAGIGLVIGSAARGLVMQMTDFFTPGMSSGLVRGLLLGVGDGWRGGLYGALLAGTILGLFGGLLGGLVYKEKLETRTLPNQGIRQSARNALWVGTGLALLAYGAFEGVYLVVDGMMRGWSAALAFGLLGGLSYGGFAWLLHYTVRTLLWWQGYVPWRYVLFLDQSANHLLLRKVGGGYMFMHRLLLEHLARKN